jgi:hypothetical protein
MSLRAAECRDTVYEDGLEKSDMAKQDHFEGFRK